MKNASHRAGHVYRGRHAYLNDFHADENGKFSYQGDCFTCTAPPARQKQYRITLWIRTALLVFLLLLGGCLSAPGSTDAFYVILPFVGEIAGAGSIVWALLRLGRDWHSLRGYVYRKSAETLPQRSFLTLVFAIAGALGESLYLLMQTPEEKLALALVYLVIQLLAAVLAALLFRTAKAIPWQSTGKSNAGQSAD